MAGQPTLSEREEGDRAPLLVDLALQGGGSHGAFTWGVLDRLLEERWLTIDGVSGTSAGAMNAAVFAHGHLCGGADGAKAALEQFWRRVSEAATFSPFQRTPIDRLIGRWSLDFSPTYLAADLMARVVSPYSLGGDGVNPLRRILNDTIEFDRLVESPIRIFITATNVRTGRARIFRNREITAEVLLASACLPTMFQSVEIDGEHYWDGGYSGNPMITPLVLECDSHDTLIVQINPVVRDEIPRTAAEINNRINEVSFNASLLKELKMISLLRKVCDPSDGEGWLWAQMRIHLINSNMMRDLGASSKLNAEWEFLTMLRDEGRRVAEEFIARHAGQMGVNSTFDFGSLIDGV